MLWRSPWLYRRRLWLALASFDSASVAGSYNVVYKLTFHSWPGLSNTTFALIFLWLSASYLLGRYSPNTIERSNWQATTSATLTGIIIATGIGAFSWGAEVQDSRAMPGFAIPIALAVAATSTLAQLWAKQKKEKITHWKLIASEDELAVIKAEAPEKSLGRGHIISYSTLFDPNKDSLLTGIAVGEHAQLSEPELEHLLRLRTQGVAVISLINWSEQHLQRVPPELLSNTWLAHAEGFDLQPDRWSWRLKRWSDLLIACILLASTIPVMGLAALLIKLEDGGPILFGQIRTGIYGEPIHIFKLRSMHITAEEQGPQWAQARDPRITRTGHWLRRLRIDELPQLLNVIRGDMSLIGPRPERPEFEKQLEKNIPHYRVRHWVRPGLSGWAQVCHPYGASSADSRTKLSYDIYYIRNFSWALDFLILLKTIRLISRGAGSEPT